MASSSGGCFLNQMNPEADRERKEKDTLNPNGPETQSQPTEKDETRTAYAFGSVPPYFRTRDFKPKKEKKEKKEKKKKKKKKTKKKIIKIN